MNLEELLKYFDQKRKLEIKQEMLMTLERLGLFDFMRPY